MNLEQTRQMIDQVDKELVALLEKRMDLVQEVVAYKKANHMPILDQSREEAVLNKIADLITNKEYEACLLGTFSDIMKHSRDFQADKLK